MTEGNEIVGNSAQPSSGRDNAFNKDLLRVYYSQIFPFELWYSWFAYDTSFLWPANREDNNNGKNVPKELAPTNFRFREISFTSDIDGEEIYSRFLSYNTQDEFKKAVLKRLPHKIDIGGVYPYAPKDKNTRPKGTKFKADTKELVFDVDLTDYDAVRLCGCSGANICIKCWQMMTMAIKVMDAGLREDFGFKRLAWIYSGRRGVHCWVADPEAIALDDVARSAVVSYFNVPTKKNEETIELPHPLHPMLTRSFHLLEGMFLEHIAPESGHGLLADPAKWNPFLETLPPVAHPVKTALIERWADNAEMSPDEKWADLKKHLQIFVHGTSNSASKSATKKSRKENDLKPSDRIMLDQWPIASVFKYCYPRLDVNVSKGRDHLLKSPFCVHPKTGRVCVPIDLKNIESFNPEGVPTLAQVVADLDSFNAGDNDTSKEKKESMCGWEKTRLAEYFVPFEKDFLKPLLKDVARLERKEKEKVAAAVVDF